MGPIVIPFEFSSLGRVDFQVDVMTSDLRSFETVDFKLDSGSDFTTISCDDLYNLGYTHEFLKNCPHHFQSASLAANFTLKLQYISNMSIKFGEREIQNCRIFFALDTGLRSLFGSDILKYFNWEVNYDYGQLRLTKAKRTPKLSNDEHPIRIYTIE